MDEVAASAGDCGACAGGEMSEWRDVRSNPAMRLLLRRVGKDKGRSLEAGALLLGHGSNDQHSLQTVHLRYLDAEERI